MSKEQLCNIL